MRTGGLEIVQRQNYLAASFTACGGVLACIESTILSASRRFPFSGIPSFWQSFVWLRSAFLPLSFSLS
jgi:hypothetical protein